MLEFDRQADELVRSCLAASTVGEDRLRTLIAPLRERAAQLDAGESAPGTVPFLLVVTREVLPIRAAMPLTSLAGKSRPGFVDHSFEEGALERFVATDAAPLPDLRAYLLVDVERGEEFCGAVPSDALATIAARGRTPLTIEEGISLIRAAPEILEKNKCFSLGGSRSGDRRVPAIWISKQAPKLGWCWEGNPHTWLGMASAAARVV